MKSLNFSLKTVSWFSSYLSGHRHYVRFNGEQSDMLVTSFGVLQGSLMGPTLFLIYINDSLQQLPPDSVTAYADDVILFGSGDSIGDAATWLQHLVDAVCVWLLGNCLQLNAAKCSCTHIALSKRNAAAVSHYSPINVAGTEIADVFSMKILGDIFAWDLDWKLQARAIRSKMLHKLGVLWRINGSLNTKSRSLIHKTCIKLHIDFCLPVWGYCGSEHTKLDNLLFKSKHLVTNNKTASILRSDFRDFSIASFSDLILVSMTCQFFKCMHMPSNFTPVLLKNIDKSVVMRASVSNKVLLTNSKRSCDNSFVYQTPKIWNILPKNITALTDYKLFLSALLKFVFASPTKKFSVYKFLK